MSSLRRVRSGGVLGVTVLMTVVVIGGVGGSASAFGSGGSTKRHANPRERWDLVGENKHGPVRASFRAAGFPARDVIVTVPRTATPAATEIHVIEDGRGVTGVEVAGLAPTATRNRYDVRYVSHAQLGEREVEMSIAVDRVGAVDLDYNAPRSVSAALAPVTRHRSFWTSSAALVVAAVAAALLLGIALAGVLSSRRREDGVRTLVGAFTAERGSDEVLEDEQTSGALQALEQILARMSWWPRFSQSVETARFKRRASELVVITILASIAAAVIVGAWTGAAVLGVLMLGAGPFALASLVRIRREKQQRLFSQQLAPHLEELASAMRAGHGLVAGLSAMVQGATEPSRTEWARVVSDEQLGKPLDAAMHALAVRMECYEVDQVALIASLHQRTGGNIAEVLDRVAEGVRERADLRRELHALTAQARLSRWVVSGLPVVLLGAIDVIDPAYLRPLFHTTGGTVVLALAVVLLSLGALVMRKLTEVKV